FPDERIENDLKESFGTGVDANAGIEIGRRLVECDRDDIGVRGGPCGAGRKEEDQPQKAQNAQKGMSSLLCILCLLWLIPLRHPADYTVTARGPISTTERRSFSIWRVIRDLRCARYRNGTNSICDFSARIRSIDASTRRRSRALLRAAESMTL